MATAFLVFIAWNHKQWVCEYQSANGAAGGHGEQAVVVEGGATDWKGDKRKFNLFSDKAR